MPPRVSFASAERVYVRVAVRGDVIGEDAVTGAAAVVLSTDEALVIEGSVEELVTIGDRIAAAARWSGAVTAMRDRLAAVAADCGYDENEDGPVGALIEYKNQLEEIAGAALVRIAVAGINADADVEPSGRVETPEEVAARERTGRLYYQDAKP